jgi:site-specific DNA-adenine methylase
MTAYQGGKKRLGKRIHDVIILLEKDLNMEEQPYLEPFVGMAGVLKHFGKDIDSNRMLYASDVNKDLILMWQDIQKGWKPPKTCSEAKYEKLKNSNNHSAERGYIGVVASWGGIFFHAYRLKYQKGKKDFMKEGYQGIQDIKPYIMNVQFKSTSYDNIIPAGDMTIYCDPPYKGNKLGLNKHSFFQNFDHIKFWDTMREWSKTNLVIISEWTAPKDFKKIWSATSHTVVNQDKGKKYSDNLYIHKSIYDQLSNKLKRELKKI